MEYDWRWMICLRFFVPLIPGLFIRFLFLILPCFLLACSAENETIEPDQFQHMSQNREHIKAVLGETYDQAVPPASDALLKRGAELYPEICASCHGGRGDGKGRIAEGIVGRPADFTDPKEAAFYSEQARLYIIRKGLPGTPMMGWEGVLPEEDIIAVYAYIRSLINTNKRGWNKR